MNGTVIFELLDEMEKNVALLDELKATPRADFVSEPRNYLYAERCFQLAIQCLIDISYYLASHKQWPKPESASEAVQLMGRQGVISPELCSKVAGMANFRNILVHAYMQVNRDIVYDLLAELQDFREFSRQLVLFLKEA